jgi:hypothetical protein
VEGLWGYAQDRRYDYVASAVRALLREGVRLREFPIVCEGPVCRWSRALAECVLGGECVGGLVFCEDPGLVVCVANKVPGLRAAAVSTIDQAARATSTFGANLLAVEMPGRTFFEVRQMLRMICTGSPCPAGVACTLQELDGHAHR